MSNVIEVPAPFSTLRQGKDVFVFKEEYRHLLYSRSEAGQKPGPGHFCGRGAHLFIISGGKRVIIKHCRHGGLWGRLAGRLLWSHRRPIKELTHTELALQKGVATAEVVGARLERVFWPFYRAELFVLEIDGAEDLVHLLMRCSLEGSVRLKREFIGPVARAIRQMHNAGVYHADLHLKNILIQGLGASASGRQAGDRAPALYSPDALPSGLKVYIIDLDKSMLFEELSFRQRAENLLRLDRSVEKFKAWRPRKGLKDQRFKGLKGTGLLTRTDKLRFLKKYFDNKDDYKAFLRSNATHHTWHRLWWWVLRALGLSLYDIPAD